MPVIKCPNCGRASSVAETGPCLRCAAVITVTAPPRKSPFKKIIFSAILGLLLLGLTGYGATYFIEWQRENARIEFENKQLAEFDMLGFDTDPVSVERAIKSLPVRFNSSPPTIEALTNDVGRIEAAKVVKTAESTRALLHAPIIVAAAPLGPTIHYSGEVVGRVGNAVLTSGGSTTIGSGSSGSRIISGSLETRQRTVYETYALSEIRPTRFEYVKAPGDILVCFVTYRALINIYKQRGELTNSDVEKNASGEKSKMKAIAGDYSVTETARYDFENGRWTFKQGGLSETNRMHEIDNLRIAAKNLPRQ